MVIGWLLFIHSKPDLVVFKDKDVKALVFCEMADTPITHLHNRDTTWYFFKSGGKIYAFEDREILADHKYTLKMHHNIELHSGRFDVWFCGDYNPIETFIVKLVILSFCLLAYLGFCGWLVQKFNLAPPEENQEVAR